LFCPEIDTTNTNDIWPALHGASLTQITDKMIVGKTNQGDIIFAILHQRPAFGAHKHFTYGKQAMGRYRGYEQGFNQ
jgi:hypothetical protein